MAVFFYRATREKDGRRNNRGIAALATILLLGAIIVEIALVAVLMLRVITGLSFGVKLSFEALAAAEAGLEDVKLKLTRDRNRSFPIPPTSYILKLGEHEATVTVCKNFITTNEAMPCGTPAIGKEEVTTIGRALTKYRRLRAVLDVDNVSGRIVEISRQEIPY